MVLREWPLVLFTLLGQLAVGSYLLLALPLLLSPRAGAAAGGRDDRLSLIVIILGILVAALLAAVFHLGNPLNVLNSLNNLGRSWLSREVLFLALTIVFLAGLALARAFMWRAPAAVAFMVVATAVAAVLFLFSMARLYMLPTVSAWNTLYTPASFSLTALLLGGTAASAAWAGKIVALSTGHIRTLLLASIVLAAAGLALAVLAAPRFGLWGAAASPGLKPPAHPALSLFLSRLVLLLAGAIVLVLQIKKTAGPSPPPAPLALLVAFGCILTGEVLGRFLFYSFYLK